MKKWYFYITMSTSTVKTPVSKRITIKTFSSVLIEDFSAKLSEL